MGKLLQNGLSLQLDRIHPQGIRLTMKSTQTAAQADERLVIEAELVPVIHPLGENPDAHTLRTEHDDFTWWAWLERDQKERRETHNALTEESPQWNRDLAELARAGLLACEDYESWLSWRDASTVFNNPREAQECMDRTATAVGIIGAWNASRQEGEIQRLVEELAAENVWIQFQHDGRGLDPDGKLSGIELLVPAEKPGTLNPTMISGYTSSQPASALAMVRLNRPREGRKRWTLEVNRTGQVVLAGLEHRKHHPMPRRHIRWAMTEISEHEEAATWGLVCGLNDRHRQTSKREDWARGRETW